MYRNIKFYHLSIVCLIGILFCYKHFINYGSKLKANYGTPERSIMKDRSLNGLPEIFVKLNNANYYRGKPINSSSNFACKIPILTPWNNLAKKKLKKIQRYDGCRKNSPLTFIKDKALFIDQNINKTYYSGEITECKFAKVIKNHLLKPRYYELADFKGFTSGQKINDDVFMVRCYKNDKMEYDYEYLHYIIHGVQKNKNEAEYKDKMNVILIGQDSTSDSTFRRALPKTFEFLKSFDNFYHFRKFHSVGASTTHNMYPLLTGYHHLTVYNHRYTHNETQDGFPWLMQNFSANNYATFHTEDWERNDFFKKEHSDHYFQHYWNALVRSKSIPQFTQAASSKPCYYDKLLHLLQFDLVRSMLKEYLPNHQTTSRVTQNFFAYCFMAEMSHDQLERLFWVDDDMLELFKEMLTPSFLENTLVIVMGDHGSRWHPIRYTAEGKLEQFLPFFSLLVPTRLKKNNKLLHEILKTNTQTLATPYDVYETLVHLLQDQTNIHSNSSEYLKNRATRSNAKNGYSLFMPLPDRVCIQAGINEEFCVCDRVANENKKLTKLQTETSSKGAQYIIDHINNVLLKSLQDKCAKYTLKEILRIDFIDAKKFTIILTTKPNTASFEADLRILDTGGFEIVGNVINRISIYGETANCIDDMFLRNFCYCAKN